ncbi:MAG: MFS transporter [Microbacteriaceae bacterium]
MFFASSGAYARVFHTPRVAATFFSSLIGRSAYALVFLPLFYLAEHAGKSIAIAGIAVALYGAGASFLAPIRAWFIDQFGARLMLTVFTVSFATSLAGLALCSLAAAPVWLILLFSLLAGVVAPPLGPTMRVAWGRLLSDSEDRKIGLSIDAVIEELLYLIGPAIAGTMLIWFAPSWVLLMPSVLVMIGGLSFARTVTVRQMSGSIGQHRSGKPRSPLMLRPAFISRLIPALVAGGISGMVSVMIPTVATQLGGAAFAGILLAAFAGGSAIGGLIYSAVTVRVSLTRQLIAMTAFLILAAASSVYATNIAALLIVLILAGLCFSPVMIVSYLVIPTVADQSQQNVAQTWLNTSHNLGSAAVMGLAAATIQLAGIPASVLVISLSAMALLMVSALVIKRSNMTGA